MNSKYNMGKHTHTHTQAATGSGPERVTVRINVERITVERTCF